MKISSSIRDAYKDNYDLYCLLGHLVDEIIKTKKARGWHFESRLKEEQSFALKLETGRYATILIDDFYAATIVVQDYSKIDAAIDIIKLNFCVLEEKPIPDVSGRQKPWDFQFADIRLICCLGDRWRDRKELFNLKFEIQIKTFLQHAWAIATHDLIYKSSEPNWSLERVAYQLKSMLEHAELSILEAKTLGTSKLIQREHFEYKRISDCVCLLHEFWSDDELPRDVKRLAENVSKFLKNSCFTIEETRLALFNKKSEQGGVLYVNLSPFNTIIEVLYLNDRNRFIHCIDKFKPNYSLLLPCDLSAAEDSEIISKPGVVIIL